MHICLVYDCLYPYTVGGGERWYRALAERLAAEGYEVTYLTLRQWAEGDEPSIPGVRIVAAGPRSELYVDGRRRIGPAVRFGFGVLRHLVGQGSRYDIVHSGSTPFFPLLAAGLARRRGRYRLVVDWIEVWTLAYWRSYLGWLKGTIAWTIQRLATRVGERAFCFSRLHERRLRDEGFRGPVDVIGVYAGPLDRPEPEPAEPMVVFAGRHIPEKGVLALPAALSRARETVPELRAEILGDGPLRAEVERLVAEAGLDGAVEVPGFVSEERVRDSIRRSLCLALPSTREGYGLVVVEAAAEGVPSVVVESPDNAALELVEDGVNGVVARSTEPDELAGAILRVHEAGPALRASTADWFAPERARALAGELARDGDAGLRAELTMHVAYNLLHLVPGETGGAEVYARRLLPALRELDPDLEMTLFLGGAAAEEDWGEGVDVVPLRFDPRSRVRRVLAEQTLLPRAVRAAAPDLLHNLFNTAPVLPQIPQVTTIHDLVFKRYPESGLLAKGVEVVVPLAARRSTRIVTDSEASKSDLVRFLGVPAENVDVAPLGPGLPKDAVGPAPAELRLSLGIDDSPLVLSVLAKRPHKNAARLIEAFAQVPEGVLVIPGYPTGYERELDERIEELELGDRVRLLGWVDDETLDGLYRAADCFVFPSLAEGFGLPVLEAMLRGAPVACSNATSLPEVAGDAALLFDPLDVEAIAVSVRRILEDRELADRLRAAGLERAQRFSWEETARRTLDSYGRALGR